MGAFILFAQLYCCSFVANVHDQHREELFLTYLQVIVLMAFFWPCVLGILFVLLLTAGQAYVGRRREEFMAKAFARFEVSSTSRMGSTDIGSTSFDAVAPVTAQLRTPCTVPPPERLEMLDL